MRIRWIYFLPCIVLTPALAKAQTQPQLPPNMMGDMITQAMGSLVEMVLVKPKLEPAVSTIDPEKKTATLKLSSISKDTLEVTLSLASDSAEHSLMPWIKDFPKTVILPPKGKQEFTVTLNVPKDAAAGTYSAIVKARGRKKSDGPAPVQTTSDSSATGSLGAVGEVPFSKLVYTVK